MKTQELKGTKAPIRAGVIPTYEDTGKKLEKIQDLLRIYQGKIEVAWNVNTCPDDDDDDDDDGDESKIRINRR